VQTAFEVSNGVAFMLRFMCKVEELLPLRKGAETVRALVSAHHSRVPIFLQSCHRRVDSYVWTSEVPNKHEDQSRPCQGV